MYNPFPMCLDLISLPLMHGDRVTIIATTPPDKAKIVNSLKLFSIIFKLEYNVKEEELIEKSYKRLMESNADMVIANDGYPPKDRGFNVDTNEVYIINEKKDVLKIPLSNKKIISMKIVDEIKKNFKNN